MKRGLELLVFLVVFIILFTLGVKGGILDFITGRATEQQTNVSVTISGSPVLGNIDNPVLACEGESLSYLFNASDIVGDALSFGISPGDPFYVQTSSSSSNATHVNYVGELYSISLTKSHIANYSRTISVTDGTFSGSQTTNFSVIEINNAPSMTTIGDKTLTLSDGSGSFYYKVNVSDTEDGNQDSGNYSFNITFTSGSAIFNISSSGIMNKSLTSSEVGNYTILVCAVDLGIPSTRRHVNISYCEQGDGTNKSDCEGFNLQVTETSVSESGGSSGSGSSGGSSGGGGAGLSCNPKWGCDDWEQCELAQEGLKLGVVSGEEYRIVDGYCILNGYEDKCGFQRRKCVDVNFCNNENNRPFELQSCYYTVNPSCNDGIKNCHSGSCEFLVDCGGSCGACATCTDGMQNQGEEGVDCGGPCPSFCLAFASPEPSFMEKLGFGEYDKIQVAVLGVVLSIFSILFVVLAIKLARVMKLKAS